jgi:hypothetical protein
MPPLLEHGIQAKTDLVVALVLIKMAQLH